MLLQGDVLAHVTTIINTDAYKLYSIYYILYVLCLYIIDLTVQFHCYTVIEMLLQFTVIIAKVAPSIATKTGLRESLLTYGFLDYVHGYMFFLTMGLIKHFFFFFFYRLRPSVRWRPFGLLTAGWFKQSSRVVTEDNKLTAG